MIYFSVGLITIPKMQAYYYRLLQMSSLEGLYALTVTHFIGYHINPRCLFLSSVHVMMPKTIISYYSPSDNFR
jgi:hypothetical protein